MRKDYALLAAFLMLTIRTYGQIATTTSLVGTVTDSSGKAIAGAKITAVDTATLDNYSAVTNQDGNYRIDFVRVGTYDVSAEFPGFSTVKHAGSIVSINQIVRNDFALSPGLGAGIHHRRSRRSGDQDRRRHDLGDHHLASRFPISR